MNLEPITLTESERLNDLEQVVLGYQREIVEVAKALREIRDSRLYRSEYKTFEAYCKAKFNFSRARGYQLISFAEECDGGESVPTTVGTVPTPANEHQARKQRKARKQSAEQDPPHIRQAGAGDDESSISSPAAPSHDEAFMDAVGISSANNFFASQVEDVAGSIIADASDEQLDAAIGQWELCLRKLRNARNARREKAA